MKRILFTIALLISSQCLADDNIVIVLDTSGSMGEYMRSAGKSRMNVAQDALIDVLSKLPKSTNVGIITFSGWAYELGPVDQDKMREAILRTRPNGGTPLWEYMKHAGTKLLQARKAQSNYGSYKILAVTDGQAGDSGYEKTYLSDIMRRGITVDCIGLDMSGDHSLATKVNGFYMRGENPESLKKAVSKSVAEVGYDGKDAVAATAFEDISGFTPAFAEGIIKGLTTFENQPIGEKAPVVPSANEQSSVTVNEATTVSESGGPGFALMGLIGIVVLGLLVLFIATSS